MGGIVGVVSSVKKRYCFGLCEMRPRKYLVDDFELERDIARIRSAGVGDACLLSSDAVGRSSQDLYSAIDG